MTSTNDRSLSSRGQITMVIMNLGPGGTQRQLCLLARALRNMGYSITVLMFHHNAFFRDALQSLRIPVVHLRFHSIPHLILSIRREIRGSEPDVVIGFNQWDNLLVELSGLPRRSFSVIVSERSLDTPSSMPSVCRRFSYRIKRLVSYQFHRLADVIVSNSHSQGAIVDRAMCRSKTRRLVIVNGVDTEHFRPLAEYRENRNDTLRLLVVARISPEKNVLRFIDAVRLVRVSKPELKLEVEWYGDRPSSQDGRKRSVHALSAYFQCVESTVESHRLCDCFRIYPAQKDVRELYLSADVMCLPSLVEGCSNVIAEAMACGIPVLASRVGDNTRLVKDDCNGFLFDPLSVEDIAGTIIRFSEMPMSRRMAQGQEGRRLAEELLSADTLAERYGALVAELIDKRRLGP